ncbi:N,N-dimethylformamidase beta subunit family domain-containing protein [Leptospira stimsonii]|uniref:Uncharacterized protein n=1 Tax=Leptospira stimsonii TaxID=2202203 RepID=A0A8B3CTX3_9LEPT|nr:N,N-dimethylformamidase beta subunit family domain-containing protein [Leptospira stimsonii]RHX88711.1 hypothetical protein DLM78_07260 [Leptospira stimsonii]
MLRIAFLLFFSITFQFCNSDTTGLFGSLFSDTRKEGSISIRNQLQNTQTIPASSLMLPIYSYEYRDTFGSQVFYYSLDSNTPTDWTPKGAAFYAFNNQRPGTVPIYQYYAVDSGGYYRFMYSSNLYCAIGTSCGWYNSGIAFYAYPNARNYTKPVFAYVVDSPQQRFLYSANAYVGVGGNWLGWTNAGTAFYVPQFRLYTSHDYIEGYSSTTSVAPGGEIKFYLNDPLAQATPSSFLPQFYKVESSIDRGQDREIDPNNNTPAVTLNTQNIDSCTVAGCSWPVTFSKTIPSTWTPGLYYLNLGTPARNIFFVVRPVVPASTSKILMVLPFSTWQAYNKWGKVGSYGAPVQSVDYDFSPYVSFDRPYWEGVDIYRHFDFIANMLDQSLPAPNPGNLKYEVEFASDIDLHRDPNLLSPYQLIMMVGHNEYISKPMRLNLDQFVMNGGNFAIFGGNTAWWQIRLAPNSFGDPDRILICYKEKESQRKDPFSDESNNQLTLAEKLTATKNWHDPSLGYPENQTFGLGYLYGTIYGPDPNDQRLEPISDRGWPPGSALQFEVKQAEHWVYNLTGLQNFQGFGLFYNADGTVKDGLTGSSSAEGDSLQFICENNQCPNPYPGLTDGKRLYPTGQDGAPMNFQILAYMDAIPNQLKNYQHSNNQEMAEKHFGAMMGVFENNGTVFNGGLYNWQLGLNHQRESGSQNTVSQIVWNVINKLKQPKTLLQKATTAIYQYSDFFNNNQSLYYSRLPFLPKNFYRFGTPIPYQYDGQAFYAFDRALSGTVPIYQYQVQDSDGLFRFMYSPNQFCPVGTGCLGWNNIGIAFYAYLSQQPGTIPVYAYSVDSPVQRFLYTPNLYCATGTDCLGWHNNGPAFYVPDSK